MRIKKNREVNIFSASVVDLFASGLGVFLIVSIIAMANQKKEMAKGGKGEYENSIVKQMEGELTSLSDKLKKLSDENFKLKVFKMSQSTSTSSVKAKNQSLGEKIEMNKLKRKVSEQIQHISKMETEAKSAQKMIAELETALSSAKNSAALGAKGIATNFSNYEIGSKIRLQDVHFYPGTDRGIEPYASREIKSFAIYMIKNQGITVEVSGHIFETRKAIESGKAADTYNLSGRRARYVCRKLVEFGVHLKRLTCVGYGANRPINLTNDQYSESAQLNRRVEVEILSK